MSLEDLTFEDAFPIVIMILFAILFVFLLVQTIKKKRYAPFLIASIFFGFLAALSQFLATEAIFEDYYVFNVFEILEHQTNLTSYGLMLFFFYLFLEDLTGLRPNILRFSVAFGLLFLDLLPLWLMFWFRGSPVVADLWLLTDIGYNVLGIFIFGCFGLWIYIKTFQYTKEGRSIALAISMATVGVGYSFLLIDNLNQYFDFIGKIPEGATIVGGAFPVIGLLIMVLSYVTNVNYLYRLPNDNYVLTVAYKSGVPIHTVKLHTLRKKVSIAQEMLTGLISAVSTMFRGTLQSEADIESITSKDATILVESGTHVVVIIVSDNVSATLSRALKRYVKEFEQRFHVELAQESVESTGFDPATSILTRVFPFFKVDDEKRD